MVVSEAIEGPLEKISGPEEVKLTDREYLIRSIDLASHIITIRYPSSVFSCLDKRYSRLPWGIWKGDARLCWILEADVTAGFKSSELKVIQRDKGGFLIKANEPKILGVDDKSSRLIYNRAGERFDWKEQDIFPDLNERLRMEAERHGILEDAKKSLEYLAASLSVKYGTTVEVDYTSDAE
jgi:hypothetical protein